MPKTSKPIAIHSTKGLHPQIAARTAKLAMLPIANPPIRQNWDTVAATETSSLLPLSFGLCSKEAAAIMTELETYPPEAPRAARMNMKRKSELMMGVV